MARAISVFPGAGFTEQKNRHLRFRRQPREAETPRHGLVARGDIFELKLGERIDHGEELKPGVFAQLPQWLEGVLDQRPAAYNDVRLAFHARLQGMRMAVDVDGVSVE